MRSPDGVDSDPGPESATDEFCMARVREGDLHGFAPLYERHHHQTQAAAGTVAGTHLAQELTGEAFGRLLILLLTGGRPSTPVRYFLYASLRESYRQRVVPGSGEPVCPHKPLPRLPTGWRHLLRGVVAEHLIAEQSAPCLCRAAEIVLEITRVAERPGTGR